MAPTTNLHDPRPTDHTPSPRYHLSAEHLRAEPFRCVDLIWSSSRAEEFAGFMASRLSLMTLKTLAFPKLLFSSNIILLCTIYIIPYVFGPTCPTNTLGGHTSSPSGSCLWSSTTSPSRWRTGPLPAAWPTPRPKALRGEAAWHPEHLKAPSRPLQSGLSARIDAVS